MYDEKISFATSVSNACYLTKRGSGACARPLKPPTFRDSQPSTLKVKQYLNRLAKQERLQEKSGHQKRLDRSLSLPTSRIFEYRVDSNKLSEHVIYSNRGYPIYNNLIKPVALKPLLFSNPDVSISEALGSELFSSGCIPTNKEIDQIIDFIKIARQRAQSEVCVRARRHSDITDSVRSSKRRIKDHPSKHNNKTTEDILSSIPENCFTSPNSAFKSIRTPVPTVKEPPRQLSLPDTIEENKEIDPPQNLHPTPDHDPLQLDKLDIPQEDKLDIPQESMEEDDKSPQITTTNPSPVPSPKEPLRPLPISPDHVPVSNSEDTQPESPCDIPPTSHSPKTRTSSTSSSDTTTELIQQHTVVRKVRHRHRKCSQPCIANSRNDEGLYNDGPHPRYTPNTHPRAQTPSYLATCTGNHPPVSYLNSMKRSNSLQVNHVALCEVNGPVKSFQSFHIVNPTKPQRFDPVASSSCSNEGNLAIPGCSHQIPNPTQYCSASDDRERIAPTTDAGEVRGVVKQAMRPCLKDKQSLQSKDPENKPSLSYVFNGNMDLHKKVRYFFQQRNKTCCKKFIKQRFESNLQSAFAPNSLVTKADSNAPPKIADIAMGGALTDDSVYEDEEGSRRRSKNLEESIQSFLLKSESFSSNKCDNHNDHDKLKKAENLRDILDNLMSPVEERHDHSRSQTEGSMSRSKHDDNAQSDNIGSEDSSNVDFVLRRNGSKVSRDSGYGESTSTSNEGLHPRSTTKLRTRSSSLTLLSKLIPLFKAPRPKDTPPSLVPEDDNLFSSIFQDDPISDFTKSLDVLISRRASLHDHTTSAEYTEGEGTASERPKASNIPSDQVHLEHLSNGVLTTSEVFSEDEDAFRVSPLPRDDVMNLGDSDVTKLEEEVSDPCSSCTATLVAAQSEKFSLQDIQEILDSLDVLQNRAELNRLNDMEYHKVHNMLQSKVALALSSIYHTLIHSTVPPTNTANLANPLLDSALDYLDELLDVEEDNETIMELAGLLDSFEGLVALHDEIISRSYYENETLPEVAPSKQYTVYQGGQEKSATQSIFRMVGLHKNKGEPLGITLKKEGEKVVVHRILSGGMIDRQRLLHIGDEIISINGSNVEPRPDIIQSVLKGEEGDVQLKILPSYKEQTPICQVYVKAHFNYDPSVDNLMPCKEAGLPFKEGDILQIVNQDDPNWWQAKIEGGEGQAGLVPGLILQEQRMAANGNRSEKKSSMGCGGTSKKKHKKMNYVANKNSEFDQHELNLYEEVAKMPPFNRKTLVLIGAQGVGRRSLISKLVLNEPDKFGNTMPHTSRPIRAGERDGGGYWFTARDKMDQDIVNHKYLEYGEYEGHLYGTKLDSIRQVMRSGKMCLLDVNPQSLKVLKTSEFVPYIVFVEAPPFETLVRMHRESARDNPNKAFSEGDLKRSIDESKRLKRQYSHYFDIIIQNNDMDTTYARLYECISKLSTSPQWVPVSWVY